jgi:tetratricopeptide (TPR) repeat protein
LELEKFESNSFYYKFSIERPENLLDASSPIIGKNCFPYNIVWFVTSVTYKVETARDFLSLKEMLKYYVGGNVLVKVLLFIVIALFKVPFAYGESANVRFLFAEGQQIYGSGDFERAAKVFARNLEKYPDHGPSQLFLGKSLYRLQRYENAWTVFQKIPNESLDQESRYESGYSAYRNKNWKRGADALTTIPESSPSFDLAMYYAAVCLINLNRLTEAEQALKKSIVLPPRFAASRKNLLAYVKAEQASQASNQPSNQTSNPPIVPKTQKPSLKSVTIEEELSDDSFEKGTGSDSPKRSFGLFYELQSVKQNMNGVRTASGNFQRSGGFVKGTFQSSSSGFGFYADFSGEGGPASKSGDSVPTGLTVFQKEDSWPNLLARIKENGTTTDYRFSVKPGMEFQSEGFQVGLFGILKLADNGDSSNRGAGGGGKLSSQFGKLSLAMSGEASRWTSDVYEEVTSFSGYISSEILFSSDFSLILEASRQVIEHSETRLEVPLGHNQLRLEAKQGLGFGLSLDGSGSLMTLENSLKNNTQGGSTTGDGLGVTWGVGLTWSPLKWMSLSFEQYLSNYTWTGIDPQVNQPTWDGSVPDYEELSVLSLKIYRTF